MWTRKELKEKGKASFKKNYWKCVLVGFFITILTGGIAFGTRGGGGVAPTISMPAINMPSRGFDIDMPEINIEESDDDRDQDFDEYDDDEEAMEDIDDPAGENEFAFNGDGNFSYNGEDYNIEMGDDSITITNEDGVQVIYLDGKSGKVEINHSDPLSEVIDSPENNSITLKDDNGNDVINISPEEVNYGAIGLFIFGLVIGFLFIMGIIIIISLIISFIVFLIRFAIDVFFVNPVEVGTRRFFRRNLEEPANISNVAYGYDSNYKNVVKVMFFRDLYTYLWSLLFLVPGIIKSYEYRMIPYLLSENPEMTKEEAFAESKRLMMGQKWNTFVLDLSFIGWHILGGLTFGILEIFYVTPYQMATNAALYETIKYGNISVEPAGSQDAYDGTQAAYEEPRTTYEESQAVYEAEPVMTPEEAYEQDVEIDDNTDVE